MKAEEVADGLAEKLLAFLMDRVRTKPCAFFRIPEDDPTAIEVGYQTDFGLVVSRFYPSEVFAEWAYRQGEAIFNDLRAGYTLKNRSGTIRILEGERAAKLESEAPELLARAVMLSFFEAFSINMSVSLKTAPEDAAMLTTQRMTRDLVQTALKDADTLQSIKVGGVDERWAAANARAAKNRAEAFEAALKQLSHEPQLDRIADYYAELYPVWRDALKIFQNNAEADWRGMVRLKYQDAKIAEHDLRFDDDLFARLSGEENELPQEVQDRISAQGGDHTPGNIAIEHAARMCGAFRYQFHVTKLLRERREQSGGLGE